MMKYKVPALSSKTPQAEQSRLLNAVRAVRGVATAQLDLESNELGITALQKPRPKHSDIQSAVSRAGFSLVPNEI